MLAEAYIVSQPTAEATVTGLQAMRPPEQKLFTSLLALPTI